RRVAASVPTRRSSDLLLAGHPERGDPRYRFCLTDRLLQLLDHGYVDLSRLLPVQECLHLRDARVQRAVGCAEARPATAHEIQIADRKSTRLNSSHAKI